MPHAGNIDAPIILVGAGRSGTSLVSKIFDLHPDCVGVGETVNLIFGPWQAVAFSSASVAPLIEDAAWVSEDARAARVVRQTFLTCFPDTKRYWMQKPIGVPKAASERFEDLSSPEAGEWYWRVLRTAFPRARYLAILRQPCDVVLSGRSHWGFEDRWLWATLATLGSYLLHADSPVQTVVHYEDLVASPEATVRQMCEAVDLPFVPRMLTGFDTVHVPTAGREDPARSGYTRRTEWTSLVPAQLLPAERQLITAVYERFGGDLEWPAHFDAPPPTPLGPPAESEVERLSAQVRYLGRSIERAMFDHAEELRRRDEAWQKREHEFAAREQDAGRLWTEQQAWIAELEKVKGWLQQQVAYWKEQAERK